MVGDRRASPMSDVPPDPDLEPVSSQHDRTRGSPSGGASPPFWRGWLPSRQLGSAVASFFSEARPLDLRLAGRTLFHAALVGLVAGLIGAAFFAALEYFQYFALELGAGYTPLRASGEQIVAPHSAAFRPWLLWLFPCLGALAGGLVARYAPETTGGGGDATIHAFHHADGLIRRRVLWAKPLASILTLGTGGAGGREGPTMHVGGALGAAVGRLLAVGSRERRVLMVAGVAAGISAVFRTPLGAALLAIEILYRDDFEAEALIPSVLASVVSYSVSISIFGETTLFGRIPHFEFVPAQLPLYALLAIFIALLGRAFLATLNAVRRVSALLPGPAWARPAWGGLALGVLATGAILYADVLSGSSGRGLGILGGGYGAAQMSISGNGIITEVGWTSVQLLLFLCLFKLLAASLTIGSGGSAGDFAPSMALGGLLGGAFGLAAQILLNDPDINPGAFALIGMGTFYGGIAHVPLAALVLVSEMAGSYDLLVPMMLAEGIALLALRKHTLYPAQIPNVKQSPVHRAQFQHDILGEVRVGEVIDRSRTVHQLRLDTPTGQLLDVVGSAPEQDVFPVLDESDRLRGMITGDQVRLIASNREVETWTIAADMMQAAVAVSENTDLRRAAEMLILSGLRELLVTDASGAIIGLIDEHDVSRAFLERTSAQSRDTVP